MKYLNFMLSVLFLNSSAAFADSNLADLQSKVSGLKGQYSNLLSRTQSSFRSTGGMGDDNYFQLQHLENERFDLFQQALRHFSPNNAAAIYNRIENEDRNWDIENFVYGFRGLAHGYEPMREAEVDGWSRYSVAGRMHFDISYEEAMLWGFFITGDRLDKWAGELSIDPALKILQSINQAAGSFWDGLIPLMDSGDSVAARMGLRAMDDVSSGYKGFASAGQWGRGFYLSVVKGSTGPKNYFPQQNYASPVYPKEIHPSEAVKTGFIAGLRRLIDACRRR